MSAAAVAAWESGQRQPTLKALKRVLDAVELDVHLEPAGNEPPPPDLVAHLRLPLTARLRLALGEPVSPYARATGPAWQGLLALGRLGTVVVGPPVALAIWLPQPARQQVDVTVHAPKKSLPAPAAVTVEVSGMPAPAALVPVTLAGSVRVWVLPPDEVLSADRRRLRQAAALLEACGSRDDAGRRRPAHRDPDEWDEAWRMLVTKGTAALQRPRGEFSRAWRLDAPASLAQIVRQQPR
jgi:hypothetical protein